MSYGIAIAIVAIIAIFAIEGVASIGGEFDDLTNWTNVPVTSQIQSFAEAIANAEGSNPAYNNPGDLVPSNWTGTTFGEGIAVFPTSDEGWQRLYYQLWLITQGASNVYSLSDTIESMGRKWTKTNQAQWAAAVAQYLGVAVTTSLSEVLA